MHYKTIVLELLEQRPLLRNQLVKMGMLFQAMELYANDLKTRLEVVKSQMAIAKPESDPSQIQSEALEMAICELESSFDSGRIPEPSAPPSLDGAMAFVRLHTRRG